MTKSQTNRSALTCPMCDGTNVIHYLPKEVDRHLSHEEIAEPENPDNTHKVSILRTTIHRDYLCPDCSQQWTDTQIIEKQEER